MESLPILREARQTSSGFSLFHPMLLVSLLLHGLLLMTPMAADTEPEEEVAEPEPEEAIALSALQQTPKAAPKASPKAAPSPSFTPIQRVQPNPNPVPNVVASPSPSSTPTPEASTTPEPEASSTSAAPEAEGTAPEEPVPEDLANLRANLIASLGSGQGAIGISPPFGYFRQPELYFNQADNGDPNFTKDPNVWLPGIVGVDWYNDRNPDAIIAQFRSQFTASGSVMEGVATGYGGRPLFMVSQNGSPLLYLNIIPAPGNISTVVVQWDRDPNTPPPP